MKFFIFRDKNLLDANMSRISKKSNEWVLVYRDISASNLGYYYVNGLPYDRYGCEIYICLTLNYNELNENLRVINPSRILAAKYK